MMKKILGILLFPLLLASCELDHTPNNEMTSGELEKNPQSAVYSTNGNYAMFKDYLEYNGTVYFGNSYIRHYFQMAEFHGDCVNLSNKTEDPLYDEMCYSDLVTAKPNAYLWWCAYHIIYGANSIIETLHEGTSPSNDHILGENYFLRALCHLHLATLYAKPYSMGRDNMGVIISTSTDVESHVRASIGDTYDQIVKDLIKAADLMKEDESRVTNHGYASRDAALGLLSRVYLYREENDKVIETVNTMLAGATPLSKLDPDPTTYFTRTLTSPETLWAVAQVAGTEDSQGRESIGSMYYTPDEKGQGGWAEMYYTDPLRLRLKRFPEDLRNSYCEPLKPDTEGKLQAHWPVESQNKDAFRLNEIRNVVKTENGYRFTDEDMAGIKIETRKVNWDTRHYIQWKGEEHEIFIDVKMFTNNTCPALMCKKFSWQDGVPMLCSPVMIRWGEVILNRAEAYAKTGQNQEALDDVNALRQRAGLSGDALYTLNNYTQAGYETVLDAVLDERFVELCYEGHRAFDVYRNKRKLDRRFAGVQPWEVIDYTDNRIQYRIPSDEISVSGIPQND